MGAVRLDCEAWRPLKSGLIGGRSPEREPRSVAVPIGHPKVPWRPVAVQGGWGGFSMKGPLCLANPVAPCRRPVCFPAVLAGLCLPIVAETLGFFDKIDVWAMPFGPRNGLVLWFPVVWKPRTICLSRNFQRGWLEGSFSFLRGGIYL